MNKKAKIVSYILGACSALFITWSTGYIYGYKCAASGGRPLFYEWQEHDWGPGWMPVREFHDNKGYWLFCDLTLNVSVVIVTPPGSIKIQNHDMRPDHAVLFKGTPYETELLATKDTLVLAAPHARLELRLSEGATGKLFTKLYTEQQSQGITQPILEEILALYPVDHPDREKIEKFIRQLK